MLTEHFIASVGIPTKPPTTNVIKDAGIFIHEYQPLHAQKTILKKSATPPNCLAVSSTHIFAAQAEKAVVHVYNREKGNQEATVPFTERITSIALACNDSVLILGTAEGRIFLWEIASGRQVSTNQSHLQDVTAVVVDPTSNFLLSASADSTVHVWSIPHLLSFSNLGLESLSPLRTFTVHKSRIDALVLGHSSSFCNFAVSASTDRTCLVWDYHTNTVLRTFLLYTVPTCLTLDAADRAIYVGYKEGSVQQLDLFASGSGHSSTFNSIQNVVKSDGPIQPLESSVWRPADNSVGATKCLSLSFDGTTLLSGHESGAILAWDTARKSSPTNLLQTPLPAAVTNLFFLAVSGFEEQSSVRFRTLSLVKPKFGAFDSSNGTIPEGYTISTELMSDLSGRQNSWFEQALHSTSFSDELLDEGLNELLTWGNVTQETNREEVAAADDFMALDGTDADRYQVTLEEQNASLKAELESLRRLQKASFDKIEKINAERKELLRREQKRMSRSKPNKNQSQANGSANGLQDADEYSTPSDEH